MLLVGCPQSLCRVSVFAGWTFRQGERSVSESASGLSSNNPGDEFRRGDGRVTSCQETESDAECLGSDMNGIIAMRI